MSVIAKLLKYTLAGNNNNKMRFNKVIANIERCDFLPNMVRYVFWFQNT